MMLDRDCPRPITGEYLEAQFDTHEECQRYRYSEACGVLEERERVCHLIEQVLTGMEDMQEPTSRIRSLLWAVVAGIKEVP